MKQTPYSGLAPNIIRGDHTIWQPDVKGPHSDREGGWVRSILCNWVCSMSSPGWPILPDVFLSKVEAALGVSTQIVLSSFIFSKNMFSSVTCTSIPGLSPLAYTSSLSVVFYRVCRDCCTAIRSFIELFTRRHPWLNL